MVAAVRVLALVITLIFGREDSDRHLLPALASAPLPEKSPNRRSKLTSLSAIICSAVRRCSRYAYETKSRYAVKRDG